MSISENSELERLTPVKEVVIPATIEQGLVGENHVVTALVDIAGIRRTVTDLYESFPDHFRHTFACKANSLNSVLNILREEGMGCEVASIGELHQALAAGFDPREIVFDSPAKTRVEIESSLDKGLVLNIDNFQEYGRIIDYMERKNSDSIIGFRINPQVGVGSIAAMSTATMTSKFGVALDDYRKELIDAYLAHPWLTGIHTHIGSQGCPFELIVSGIQKVVKLVEDINDRAGRQQIHHIDIGGGLPVNFKSEKVTPTFKFYSDMLRENVPQLFSGAYSVITEFGRAIVAKNGFMLARVEYTKTSGGRHIAITHAGAHVAPRTVFSPESWRVRLSIVDCHGHLRTGETNPLDIAGPCCFSGDMIASERSLPATEVGDFVVLHDTGAYYFSTPFHYNSLQRCAVYGFKVDENAQASFEMFRKEETTEDILVATTSPN